MLRPHAAFAQRWRLGSPGNQPGLLIVDSLGFPLSFLGFFEKLVHLFWRSYLVIFPFLLSSDHMTFTICVILTSFRDLGVYFGLNF